MTLIAWLTDFGTRDGYVAAMKAVALGICPNARFLDITHEVAAQSVDQAAYVLGAVVPYLPAGCIVVGVVDPGVGTDRPAVAIEAEDRIWVGPDNGLWSDLLNQLDGRTDSAAGLRPVPPRARAVRLANPAYWRPEVSATFHGRDIFAPVAAHLAAGIALDELGPPVRLLSRLAGGYTRDTAGRLRGRIRHIDHFGNAITSIPGALVTGPATEVVCGSVVIAGLSRTYGAAVPGAPIALIGSAGDLEIAVPNGSAAQTLGLQVGDPVVVSCKEDS